VEKDMAMLRQLQADRKTAFEQVGRRRPVDLRTCCKSGRNLQPSHRIPARAAAPAI
jgi:hypothetical protein